MKRVLILTEFYPPNNSGVSQSVRRFVNLLIQKGCTDVQLAVIEPLTDVLFYPQYRKECTNGIVVWHINAGKRRALTNPEDIRVCEYMLKQIVIKSSIDAIHAYNIFNAGYIAYRIYMECKLPYILSIRGNDLTRKMYSYGDLYAQKQIINNASFITCVNGFLQDCLLKNFSGSTDKSRVIYNSVLPEKQWAEFLSHKNELREYHKVYDKYVFTYIGKIKEKKQTMMLIDAFTLFNRFNPDTVLYIVGYVYQEDKANFQKQVKKCKNIIHVPKVPHEEVGAYYAISDVFVQMSYDDGLPNTLLEAMYMQVPVIASSIFSDFLNDGVDALLVDPFSIEDLLNAMYRLYTNSCLREALKDAAARLLSDKLSNENECSSFLKIYEEI